MQSSDQRRGSENTTGLISDSPSTLFNRKREYEALAAPEEDLDAIEYLTPPPKQMPDESLNYAGSNPCAQKQLVIYKPEVTAQRPAKKCRQDEERIVFLDLDETVFSVDRDQISLIKPLEIASYTRSIRERDKSLN